MAKDHYIPAAIVGQFSSATTGALRDRVVVVQRPGRRAYPAAARDVGFVNNLYDVGDGMSFGVDPVWTGIEKRLAEAIAVLEHTEVVTADLWLRVLVPYMTCLFVRGKEWGERFGTRFGEEWQEAIGLVPEHNANGARLIELQRTLALVACARWTIVHSQSMYPLLNNDLGFTWTGDTSTGDAGWLAPLSKRVAIAIFPRTRRTVVAWDGSRWNAVLEHLNWPDRLIRDVNLSIACNAQDFVVGPDARSVDRVASDVGTAPNPNAILDAWPFTGPEKRQNELLWHQLVGTTHRRVPPGQSGRPVGGEGLLDDALLEGWCPPPVITINPGPRRDGLHYKGNSIRMSLRD